MKRPLWALLAFLSCTAQAHPVDEVVQAAYLTLTPGGVLLELDLTPGPLVAGMFIKALDPNGDGKATATEKQSYARLVLGQSTLTLGGTPVTWTLDQVEVPTSEILKGGSGMIKIFATAIRTDRAGPGTFTYQNRYQPVKSQWLANVFLLPAASWQYGVSGQQHSTNGQALTVTYTATHR